MHGKSFLLGFLLATVLIGIGMFFYSADCWLDEFEQSYACTDGKARQRIQQTFPEFTLPPSITDPYCFSAGFQDSVDFIAFSGPVEVLDGFVEAKTGKKIRKLERWHGQIDATDFSFEPGIGFPQYRTMFYDPARVKQGLFFQQEGNGEHWHLIYDRDGRRVYYNFWNS